MNTPYKRNVRAIKYHQCDCCADTISKGENYLKLTFFSTEVETVRLCWACRDMYLQFHENHIMLYSDIEELCEGIHCDVRAERRRETLEQRADAEIEDRLLRQKENEDA